MLLNCRQQLHHQLLNFKKPIFRKAAATQTYNLIVNCYTKQQQASFHISTIKMSSVDISSLTPVNKFEPGRMEYRYLGPTGLKVSVFSLGKNRIPGNHLPIQLDGSFNGSQ